MLYGFRVLDTFYFTHVNSNKCSYLAAGAEPPAADPIAAVLAEEFLRMLLMIFSERTMAGRLSHEQLIERAIVSRLALGQCYTHNSLRHIIDDCSASKKWRA